MHVDNEEVAPVQSEDGRACEGGCGKGANVRVGYASMSSDVARGEWVASMPTWSHGWPNLLRVVRVAQPEGGDDVCLHPRYGGGRERHDRHVRISIAEAAWGYLCVHTVRVSIRYLWESCRVHGHMREEL